MWVFFFFCTNWFITTLICLWASVFTQGGCGSATLGFSQLKPQENRLQNNFRML